MTGSMAGSVAGGASMWASTGSALNGGNSVYDANNGLRGQLDTSSVLSAGGTAKLRGGMGASARGGDDLSVSALSASTAGSGGGNRRGSAIAGDGDGSDPSDAGTPGMVPAGSGPAPLGPEDQALLGLPRGAATGLSSRDRGGAKGQAGTGPVQARGAPQQRGRQGGGTSLATTTTTPSRIRVTIVHEGALSELGGGSRPGSRASTPRAGGAPAPPPPLLAVASSRALRVAAAAAAGAPGSGAAGGGTAASSSGARQPAAFAPPWARTTGVDITGVVFLPSPPQAGHSPTSGSLGNDPMCTTTLTETSTVTHFAQVSLRLREDDPAMGAARARAEACGRVKAAVARAGADAFPSRGTQTLVPPRRARATQADPPSTAHAGTQAEPHAIAEEVAAAALGSCGGPSFSPTAAGAAAWRGATPPFGGGGAPHLSAGSHDGRPGSSFAPSSSSNSDGGSRGGSRGGMRSLAPGLGGGSVGAGRRPGSTGKPGNMSSGSSGGARHRSADAAGAGGSPRGSSGGGLSRAEAAAVAACVASTARRLLATSLVDNRRSCLVDPDAGVRLTPPAGATLVSFGQQAASGAGSLGKRGSGGGGGGGASVSGRGSVAGRSHVTGGLRDAATQGGSGSGSRRGPHTEGGDAGSLFSGTQMAPGGGARGRAGLRTAGSAALGGPHSTTAGLLRAGQLHASSNSGGGGRGGRRSSPSPPAQHTAPGGRAPRGGGNGPISGSDGSTTTGSAGESVGASLFMRPGQGGAGAGIRGAGLAGEGAGQDGDSALPLPASTRAVLGSRALLDALRLCERAVQQTRLGPAHAAYRAGRGHELLASLRDRTRDAPSAEDAADAACAVLDEAQAAFAACVSSLSDAGAAQEAPEESQQQQHQQGQGTPNPGTADAEPAGSGGTGKRRRSTVVVINDGGGQSSASGASATPASGAGGTAAYGAASGLAGSAASTPSFAPSLLASHAAPAAVASSDDGPVHRSPSAAAAPRAPAAAPSLSHLWTYRCASTDGLNVSCMAWARPIPDLVLPAPDVQQGDGEDGEGWTPLQYRPGGQQQEEPIRSGEAPLSPSRRTSLSRSSTIGGGGEGAGTPMSGGGGVRPSSAGSGLGDGGDDGLGGGGGGRRGSLNSESGGPGDPLAGELGDAPAGAAGPSRLRRAGITSAWGPSGAGEDQPCCDLLAVGYGPYGSAPSLPLESVYAATQRPGAAASGALAIGGGGGGASGIAAEREAVKRAAAVEAVRARVAACACNPRGCIALWSPSLPHAPLALLPTPGDVGVASLSFSRVQPHLLAAGLHDGSLCVYDVRKALCGPMPVGTGGDAGSSSSSSAACAFAGPVLISDKLAPDCHLQAVWSVVWAPRSDGSGGEVLTSVSSDGRVTAWGVKRDLTPRLLMLLQRERPPQPPARAASHAPVAVAKALADAAAKQRSALGEAPLACGVTDFAAGGFDPSSPAFAGPAGDTVGVLSRTAGGLCLAFAPGDPTTYFVGTDDGSIARCSTSYRERALEVTHGHAGPVYRVAPSPYLPAALLTCSGDGSVRLWNAQTMHPSVRPQAAAAVGGDGGAHGPSGTGTGSGSSGGAPRCGPCVEFGAPGSSREAVSDVAWCPADSTLFGAVSRGGKVALWRASHAAAPLVSTTVRMPQGEWAAAVAAQLAEAEAEEAAAAADALQTRSRRRNRRRSASRGGRDSPRTGGLSPGAVGSDVDEEQEEEEEEERAIREAVVLAQERARAQKAAAAADGGAAHGNSRTAIAAAAPTGSSRLGSTTTAAAAGAGAAQRLGGGGGSGTFPAVEPLDDDDDYGGGKMSGGGGAGGGEGAPGGPSAPCPAHLDPPPPVVPLTCVSFAPSGGGRVLLVGDSCGRVSVMRLTGADSELAAQQAAIMGDVGGASAALGAGPAADGAAGAAPGEGGDDMAAGGGEGIPDVLSAVTSRGTITGLGGRGLAPGEHEAQLLALARVLLPLV